MSVHVSVCVCVSVRVSVHVSVCVCVCVVYGATKCLVAHLPSLLEVHHKCLLVHAPSHNDNTSAVGLVESEGAMKAMK